MENLIPQLPDTYHQLLTTIGETLESGRMTVYQVANAAHLKTNWEIGRHIVEYEQGGSDRAEYGTQLLKRLSKDLTALYGKGFSRSNVNYMRLFYKRFPIVQSPVQLEWTHPAINCTCRTDNSWRIPCGEYWINKIPIFI